MNQKRAPGFLMRLTRKRPPVFIILFLVILCLPMLKSIWSPVNPAELAAIEVDR